MHLTPLPARTVTMLKSLLALLLLLLLVAPAVADAAPRGRATTAQAGPVPKASCGPNDRVESGLQGQTTLAERLSGDSELGYNCNLELVGQYQGEGSNWQMDAFRDCAYFGTAYTPEQQRHGTVVVDASDPRAPRASAILDAHAMLNPHESLKVHEGRRLLGATKGPDYEDPEARQFAFYDISGDCANPRLLSEIDVPGHVGHAGDFAPDGMTYWGTGGGGITAMDVSDPSNPRLIGRWPHMTHDISISADGTRAYLAQQGNFQPFGQPGPNGLVILDVSDIQFRRPNPEPRVISSLFWDDGGIAQQTIPVNFKGRAHLIFTDETGAGPVPGTAASRAAACDLGLPPFGFARIIDISDETSPRIVSRLMLEVHDPANCDAVLPDFPPETSEFDFYGYSTHYCGVDKARNPKLLACGYLGAGLRVFDIRDPVQPREIAYYKPPAQRTAFLPGSALWYDYRGGDRTTDRVQTQVHFRRHKGELHIWFNSQDNGFQIVRFTDKRVARAGSGKFGKGHPGNRN